MRTELEFAKEFGAHLADGEAAVAFRLTRIEPYISLSSQVVFDFTGVRNANSSFINALIVGMVERHGEDVLARLRFKGCNPLLRVLVESAIDLGLQKIGDRVEA
jgi:hypothetical protein